MREKMESFAKSIGVNKIGFSKNQEGKTVIVALFPYYVANETGNIAMYARGRDYHKVCMEKLEQISQLLEKMGVEVYQKHVDNGGLDDRYAAYMSGLGFFGKNGMMICDEYGSYFFIGQIICNLEIEADAPLERQCLQCGACVDACIGEAIGNGRVSRNACVSHLTQKKGELTKDEQKKIHRNGMVWGCDICQTVCPHNQSLQTTAMQEFMQNRVTHLDAGDLDGLSNNEFKSKYKDYAFVWRGVSTLRRNTKIVENDTL